MVDTGVIDCCVPASRLREIGIEPRGRRSYQLADGTERAMDVGVAQIEFMGEVVDAGKNNKKLTLGWMSHWTAACNKP